MKILIATDTYYPIVNGASYAAQRLVYWLQRTDNEVLVIAPSRSFANETFFHDGVCIQGISSFPVERIRVAIPVISQSVIKQAIINFQPDIVHIEMHFLLSRQTCRIAQKMGIPVVGTNHFMPENLVHYLHIPEIFHSWVKRLAWRDFFRLFNTLDAVTVPTAAAAKLLRDVGFTKEITVISNGIDTSSFRPSLTGADLRKRYGLPNCPILLFVGRLDKEKNLDVVIRGFESSRYGVEAHFVIAGLGAEKKRLERLVIQLGIADAVTFTGFVPDVDLPNLYAISACFIIGGTAELQSIAAMEAMASGLPVIAADAVALPELVHHKENGFLFKPGDVAGITASIEKIFSSPNLRKSMGKRSLDLIKAHDMHKVIKQYETLYHYTIITTRHAG